MGLAKLANSYNYLLTALVLGALSLSAKQGKIVAQSKRLDCLLRCHHANLPSHNGRRVTKVESCYNACLRANKKGQLNSRVSTWKKPLDPGELLTLIRLRREMFPRKSLNYAMHNATDCPPALGKKDWFPDAINATFGQYENSTEWFVNLTWTPLHDLSDNWTSVLIQITVERQRPFTSPLCFVIPKNSSSLIVDRTVLSGWKYPDYVVVGVRGLPMSQPVLKMKTFCPSVSSSVATPTNGPNHKARKVAIIIVGSGIGLVLVVAFLYYLSPCRPRIKKSKQIPEGFEFHVFIIFSRQDEYWVRDILLPFLEEKHGYKCCVHFRDFIPGIPVYENMAHAVYKSYKILAVLSNNFMQSNFCIDELQMAIYRLLEYRDHCVAGIRIDDIKCHDIPKRLRKLSFIDYSRTVETAFWKRKLLKFLDAPVKRTSRNSNNSDSTVSDTLVKISHSNNNNNNSNNSHNDINRSRSSSGFSNQNNLQVRLSESDSLEVLV